MGNTVNDRELILEILLAVTRDGEYSHIALRNVLENYQYLDKSERAFITRVTEGTLERMIELDYIINLNLKDVGMIFCYHQMDIIRLHCNTHALTGLCHIDRLGYNLIFTGHYSCC